MAWSQVSSFCGVLSKGNEIQVQNNFPFQSIHSPNCHFYSDKPISGPFLFSGNIYNLNQKQFSIADSFSYEGSWSAAIYENDKLILSRDRVGVRNIYYIDNEDYFCFSNTIKALMSLPFFEKELSMTAAFKTLVLEEAEDLNDSLLQNVREVPPGKYLVLDQKEFQFTIQTYYQFKSKTPKVHSLTETSKLLRNELSEKIKMLHALDQPIAAFLSGGIDSSVLAVCADDNGLKLPYITACSEFDRYNELNYAQTIVNKIKANEWNQVLVGNIEKSLEELHLAMELPTSSLGTLLQFEMMRFAQFKGFRYILDGTGADAIFAGHKYYKAIYWRELIQSSQLFKLKKELRAYKGPPNWFIYYLKNQIKYKRLPRLKKKMKADFYLRNNDLFKAINPDFWNSNLQLFEQQKIPSVNSLDRFLTEEFFDGTRKLLRFLDRIGIYFGVQNISIFSEFPTLFELGLSIPSKFKINQGIQKFILRESFKDLLPIEVYKRQDKMGLVAPNNLWMKAHKDLLLSYIDDGLDQIYKPAEMRDSLSLAIDQCGEKENFKIFKFISFAIWFKLFISRKN